MILALASAQARQLLDAASGDRVEALYFLALTTGLGEGKLLALHWSDVDFDSGVAHDHGHRGAPSPSRCTGKGTASARSGLGDADVVVANEVGRPLDV